MDVKNSKDIKAILKKFDEHSWKGSFSKGEWSIANGGYDLWFQIYHRDIPVIDCTDGELEVNVSDDDNLYDTACKLIIKEYTHLKYQEPDNVDIFDKIQLIGKSNRYRHLVQWFGDCALYEKRDGVSDKDIEEAYRILKAFNE